MHHPPLRVLIVDDQPSFRAMLEALLASAELEIVGSVGDGAEGVRLTRELCPDVVLMDITMPVMGGIDATRAIRAENPDVVVVVLSGSSARVDVEDARRAGASAYVTKSMLGSLAETVYCAARMQRSQQTAAYGS